MLVLSNFCSFFFCFLIPGAKYVPQSGQVGTCWENAGDFEISPCLYDSIPKISQIFLKPIIQVPEILGMLKHMGEETREALSDGQVAEVQAQKVRDRSGWTWEINSPDVFGAGFSGDQLSWFAVKGVQVVEIVAQLLDFQEFLGLSAAKTKEIKAAGLES